MYLTFTLLSFSYQLSKIVFSWMFWHATLQILTKIGQIVFSEKLICTCPRMELSQSINLLALFKTQAKMSIVHSNCLPGTEKTLVCVCVGVVFK